MQTGSMKSRFGEECMVWLEGRSYRGMVSGLEGGGWPAFNYSLPICKYLLFHIITSQSSHTRSCMNQKGVEEMKNKLVSVHRALHYSPEPTRSGVVAKTQVTEQDSHACKPMSYQLHLYNYILIVATSSKLLFQKKFEF